LLSPIAPHLAEELWEKLGEKNSIFNSSWPKFDEKILIKTKIHLPIQINGKLRDIILIDINIPQKKLEELILQKPTIQKTINHKKIAKIIYVNGKIINFVVK